MIRSYKQVIGEYMTSDKLIRRDDNERTKRLMDREMMSEEEREELDSIIAEKLAMLEQTQSELENMSGGMNNLPIFLLSAISLLAVLALADLIIFN